MEWVMDIIPRDYVRLERSDKFNDSQLKVEILLCMKFAIKCIFFGWKVN